MLDDDDNALPALPPTPLGWLAHLASREEISAVERDAGEILTSLGNITMAGKKGSARVSYNWRYPNGIWTILFETASQAQERYDAALAAADNDAQRKTLVATLVAREPTQTPAAELRPALKSIARHWWGAAAIATTVRNGVTLARTSADADNDNAPTPERVSQEATGRDNFQRLLVRGQIDEDPEVATALYAAGLRYETEHQLAYSGLYNSPDYSAPIVDGSSGTKTPITERAELARARIKAARNAMGARCADVVDAVILYGMTLEAAGRRYTAYSGKDTAAAAAKERLNAGLRALAICYGTAVRRVA